MTAPSVPIDDGLSPGDLRTARLVARNYASLGERVGLRFTDVLRIAKDTILQAAQRPGIRSYSAYVAGAARLGVLKALRDESRQLRRTRPVGWVPLEDADDHRPLSGSLTDPECAVYYKEIIGMLTGEEAKLFREHVLCGYSLSEIARRHRRRKTSVLKAWRRTVDHMRELSGLKSTRWGTNGSSRRAA